MIETVWIANSRGVASMSKSHAGSKGGNKGSMSEAAASRAQSAGARNPSSASARAGYASRAQSAASKSGNSGKKAQER
jgi:hypothetical protein